MLGGYKRLTFSDGFGDKPSHSIRCVYRADLILCRWLTDHLVTWTAIELAKMYKFQLPVRSARVSHYDPRKWQVSCVSGGHLSNGNL